MSRSYTSSPPSASMACSGTALAFFYLIDALRCYFINIFFGRAMAQTVSHRPLTAEAYVRARVSPRGIWSGQSGTGKHFALSSSVFPVFIIPPWLSILMYYLRDKQ
jgi:hypothetical protein